MKCGRVREFLAADYLDGELGAEARTEVERHLDACPGCRRFGEEVRRLAVEPLRNTPRLAAPASLWPKVMQAIEREGERGGLAALRRAWRSLRFPAAAYAAASAAAAVIVAVSVFRGPYTPGVVRTEAVDAEDLRAYLQEQYSALAYNGDSGSSGVAGGDVADIAAARFGTLVEEYLM